MNESIAMTMFVSGSVLVMLVMIFVGNCWKWYSGFWGRRLTAFERVQFLFSSSFFGLIALGTLAWLITFIGIILNAMYQIIL